MEKAFMFPNLLGLEIAHNISNYIILKMASSYCKEIGKYNFHMTILQDSHIFCCCQTAYWSKSDLCFEGHQDTTVYFQIEERLGKHSTENSRMEVKHFNNYLPILFLFSVFLSLAPSALIGPSVVGIVFSQSPSLISHQRRNYSCLSLFRIIKILWRSSNWSNLTKRTRHIRI